MQKTQTGNWFQPGFSTNFSIPRNDSCKVKLAI
jgi:hypothetical protein